MSYSAPRHAAARPSVANGPMHQFPPDTTGTTSETTSAAESVTSADLRAMPVSELARFVNPGLLSDLKNVAPGVLNGLIAQHCSLPPTANSQAAAVAPQPPPLGVAPMLGVTQPGRGGHTQGEPNMNSSEYAGAERGLKHGAPSEPTSKSERRKLLRATRNRQSAASSRERKKRHLRELQRRLELLTSENIRLEQSEIDSVRDRFAREDQLIEEGKQLKYQLSVKAEKCDELARKADEGDKEKAEQWAKPPSIEKKLEKPKTWDNSSLGKALRSFPF